MSMTLNPIVLAGVTDGLLSANFESSMKKQKTYFLLFL